MQVAPIPKARTVALATLVMKVMSSLVLIAITVTPRAMITPRAPIQNAVMNAAAKLDSLKMVSIATISMNVPWVPIHETKMLLVKIISVHMYVNAPMVTVLNAKIPTNANCYPVMKMRRATILLEVTIVSAMSTSVRIQDSVESIRFALMNQVVTNVTVT